MEKDLVNNCKCLAIAGSVGAFDSVITILEKINQQFPFPIVIVLHRHTNSNSLIADMISEKTLKTVLNIEDKDAMQHGVIYIAPPDYHLLVEKDNSFSLDYSEKVNFSRPSIDVFLQSAADVYKENFYAIILSGANNDGVRGALDVVKTGGYLVVQNPDNLAAEAAILPKSVIGTVKEVNAILNLHEIPFFINNLKGIF